jgi:hypothetical protein
MSQALTEHTDLILDGTKIQWHLDRVRAWERGERIAPITIDMALTRACNYACHFCYAMLQENDRQTITRDVIVSFLDDCAEIGVKGISLVSDGESTISPVFVDAVVYGSEVGLSMACGTNGFIFNRRKLEEVLPHLTYLRINISAGERRRYAEIMGVKEEWFDRVVQNIRDMVDIKKRERLPVTIGLQMVLDPRYGDQILPLARLGKELRPDYLVIKHCSDDEDGTLGVDYEAYDRLYDTPAGRGALRRRVRGEGEVVEDRGQGPSQLPALLRAAVHAADLRLGADRAVRDALQRALQEDAHRQHLRAALQGHLDVRPILGGRQLPGLARVQRPEDVRHPLPAAQGQRVPRRLQERPASPEGAGGAAPSAPRLRVGGSRSP